MIETPVDIDLDNPDLLAGLVEAKGIAVAESPPALRERMRAVIDAFLSGGEAPPEDRRTHIRDLLRRGGFKPAGRNKPASEYLAACAAKGEFPSINNIVDMNNIVSLRYGLPASIVDTDLALAGTDRLVLRLGAAGESYVFNPSGQEIDVSGLICLARAGGAALANAVKDSMESKTHDGTKNLLAVLYASRLAVDREQLDWACAWFRRLLEEHAGAGRTAQAILPHDGSHDPPHGDETAEN